MKSTLAKVESMSSQLSLDSVSPAVKQPQIDVKQVGTCLLYAIKGLEATVLFLGSNGDCSCYSSKRNMFPLNSKHGTWFDVTYIRRSAIHITIHKAVQINPFIPTRIGSTGITEILSRITAVKDHFLCSYGSVDAIKDSDMTRRIRASLNGEYAWCTFNTTKHIFSVVELRESANPTTSEEQHCGVVGQVTTDIITFIMIHPNRNYFCFKMKAESFPDKLCPKTCVGRWYKLWLSNVNDVKQYVRSEEIPERRLTRVHNGRLELAINIYVHPITHYYVCEFGKLLMPTAMLKSALEAQKSGMYWCSFDLASTNYRIRIVEPMSNNPAENEATVVAKQQEALTTSTKATVSSGSSTTETSLTNKYSTKKSGEALCISVKGDEATMLLLVSDQCLLRYYTKRAQYSCGVEVGTWYNLNYQSITGSEKHIKVDQASVCRSPQIISRYSGSIQIQARVWKNSKGDIVCQYGRVSQISDKDRNIVMSTACYVNAWVSPGPSMQYIVFELCDKPVEPNIPVALTPSFGSKKAPYQGIVCTEHQGVFFIYSSKFNYEVIFISAKNVEIIVGDWVEFDVWTTQRPSRRN